MGIYITVTFHEPVKPAKSGNWVASSNMPVNACEGATKEEAVGRHVMAISASNAGVLYVQEVKP